MFLVFLRLIKKVFSFFGNIFHSRTARLLLRMLFGVLELKNFLMSENSGKEYFVQQIQIGSDAASCNATNGTPLYPLKSDIS